jgi:hypothetical protein
MAEQQVPRVGRAGSAHQASAVKTEPRLRQSTKLPLEQVVTLVRGLVWEQVPQVGVPLAQLPGNHNGVPPTTEVGVVVVNDAGWQSE